MQSETEGFLKKGIVVQDITERKYTRRGHDTNKFKNTWFILKLVSNSNKLRRQASLPTTNS